MNNQTESVNYNPMLENNQFQNNQNNNFNNQAPHIIAMQPNLAPYLMMQNMNVFGPQHPRKLI